MRPAVSPESSTRSSFSRIAHGDTAPSISTGTATSASTPNSEPAKPPIETLSNASTDSDSSGCATNGTTREQDRRDEHEQAQPLHVRVAVGQPAAEPVADRQRDEHDADRVRPHDRRVAEVRGDQPRDGDLRPEGRDADDEDEQPERRPAAIPHAASSMARRRFPTGRGASVRRHGHRRPRPSRPHPPLAPVHPAARLGAGGAGDDRARRGHAAVRHRRQRVHRRRLVAVVHRPRPRPPGDRRRGARAARPGRALDDARPLAPGRGASSPRGWWRSRRPGWSACSTPTTARPPPRSR